jgi:hypothetical protein
MLLNKKNINWKLITRNLSNWHLRRFTSMCQRETAILTSSTYNKASVNDSTVFQSPYAVTHKSQYRRNNLHINSISPYIWSSIPRNVVLQQHIVYKTMLYYCFSLHNSWYRYTIRFFRSPTCFGLMGAILRYIRTHNHLFPLLLLPPHWSVFTHWECIVYMIFLWCPVLPNILNT